MESSQRHTWDPFFGWLLGTATLPELSEGQHNLTVNFKTYINITGRSPSVEGLATVFFSIADTTPPNITVHTEAIYNQTSFPLNFTVNEPTSWIAYNLDGGAQTPATEKTTVTVGAGNHTLIVCANDTSGKIKMDITNCWGNPIWKKSNCTHPASYRLNKLFTGIVI